MTYRPKKQRIRRFSTNDRDYKDPAYTEFRKEVLKRDCRCCQWPKCGATRRLHVHHIRTWSEHPNLRYIVSNGITLCKTHHDSIWGKEEQHERLFASIVGRTTKDPEYAKRDRAKGDKSKKGNVGKNKRKKSNSFASRYAKAKRRARKR